MTDHPPVELTNAETDRTPAQWLRWFERMNALGALRKTIILDHFTPNSFLVSCGLDIQTLGDTTNELRRVVARAEAEERHRAGIERLQAVADLCETMRDIWAGLVYDGGVHANFMDAIIPALDAVKAEEKPNGEL
jgi:hypothetical protein